MTNGEKRIEATNVDKKPIREFLPTRATKRLPDKYANIKMNICYLALINGMDPLFY